MSASDAHGGDGSSVSINLSSAHKLAIYRTLYDFGLINATWDRTLAAIRRQRVLHDVPDDVVIPFVKQLLAAVAQGDAIASSDVIGQRRIEDLRRQLGLLQALWQVFVEGSGVVPPDVCATLQWQDVSKWWTRSHDILLVQNTFRSGYGPDHYQRLVDSNAADLLAPIKRHIAAQKLSGAEPSTSATMRYFTHSLKKAEARPAWGQRINDVFVSAASAIATAARKSLFHGLAFVATPLMTPILHGGAVTFTVNEASLSGAVVGFAPHSPHLALDTDIGKALAQCFVVKMPTTSAARPTTRSTSDGVVIAACSHTELDTVQTGLATGSVITIRCPDRDVVEVVVNDEVRTRKQIPPSNAPIHCFVCFPAKSSQNVTITASKFPSIDCISQNDVAAFISERLAILERVALQMAVSRSTATQLEAGAAD